MNIQELKKRDGILGQYINTKAVTSDYTINYDEDYSIVVAAITQDITITLPLLSVIEIGKYKNFEFIPIVANGYRVRISTQGADVFPFGNTWFDMPKSQKQFEIGASPHGFNLRRNISLIGEYHRPNVWNASNFNTLASIPLTIETKNTQPQLIRWGEDGSGGTNPSRIYVETSASYDISFGLDIDSTGGSTWNILAGVYINSILMDYAEVRTGNYGGEDQSLTFLPKSIDLDSGDYVEIKVIHTNLTGNLIGCTLNINTRL